MTDDDAPRGPAAPVAWLCRWTENGETLELVVWAATIEDARRQARQHSAGPTVALATRIATRQEAGQ